ncbi:odorant receptor 30a-like [Vespula maculifrons]|uniref:Odorant receptor 30a-like n=1 Tax=Vespula maculifrons TaxID=7453 RepID=A0ABD2AQX1_VESMC
MRTINLKQQMLLLNGIYAYRDNLEIMIQSMCIATALVQMSIKMTACRMQRSSFQYIIAEMENIVKLAAPHEKAVLQKYVNRSALLHIFLTFGFYLSSTNIVLGPIFLSQSLPTFAVYPFDTASHPVYEIVYFTQAITGIQASTGATIDCQVALLLWFAGARFEMLEIEIANSVDEYDLNRCIEKHRQILSYAEKIVKTVRFVILATVGITTILIVFSGLLLLFSDSVTVKFQFLVLDIVAISQLFLNSHPAENLIEMSTAIGLAAYDLNWFDKSRKMCKNICILIQRSQKPVTISIAGFIPELSLTYYMSVEFIVVFLLIMVFNITPETALKFTKMSVVIMGCWPPPLNATKKQLLLRDIYWWMSFVTATFLLLALINGIYEHRRNTLITIQTTCILAGVCQMCIKMVILRKQRWKFQSIILEMENFVKRANPLEKSILQNYVNRCAVFHLTTTIGFYVICSGLILGPAILSQPFPTFAKYPFQVDSHPIYDIVYFQQAFVGMLAAVGGTIDCQAAVLLWFASARFEILCIELTRFIDLFDLNCCIRKHLHLLRYAEDVVISVRYIIFITTCISTLIMIFGGLQLIFAKSTIVKIQFVILVIGSAIQLFLCSRPAENLSGMSTAIGLSVYNSNWIGQSTEVLKNICILIQRSQKPVIVSINGVLPALSLKYYASAISILVILVLYNVTCCSHLNNKSNIDQITVDRLD